MYTSNLEGRLSPFCIAYSAYVHFGNTSCLLNQTSSCFATIVLLPLFLDYLAHPIRTLVKGGEAETPPDLGFPPANIQSYHGIISATPLP